MIETEDQLRVEIGLYYYFKRKNKYGEYNWALYKYLKDKRELIKILFKKRKEKKQCFS